jgi:uncharacterized protein
MEVRGQSSGQGDPAVAPLSELGASALRQVVERFAAVLHAHQVRLNRLNVYPVPDGDTGTNMARTVAAVAEEVAKAPVDDLTATAGAIRLGSLMGARGNSGVILSQILRGLADTIADTAASAREVGAATVAAALQAASDAAYASVRTPVEGTILTVAREAAAAADAAVRTGATLVDVLGHARRAGREALDRTPDLLPALRDAGVVDAGGAGFLLLFDAALSVVTGQPLPDVDMAPPPPAWAGPSAPVEQDADRFELMFVLQDSTQWAVDQMVERWSGIGGSIAVVGDERDGMWTCHVHTDHLGPAVEAAIAAGRPTAIRISDLAAEVAALGVHRETWQQRLGVVAVASGPGVIHLLAQAGADVVVHGGQSANPSTADIVRAITELGCPEVVVLPGNKNVIAAARQAAALVEGRVNGGARVIVVPTRSPVQSLAALRALAHIAADRQVDAVAVADELRAAAATVTTGEVTQAVRSAQTPAGIVQAGDWLGIVDGVITCAAVDQGAVAVQVAEVIGAQQVLVGDTADAAAVTALVVARPGIEVIDAGQPVFALVMS